MEAWKGSAWREIHTGDAYVNAAWRVLQYAEAYIGGAWETIVSFVQPMSVAISPLFISSLGPTEPVTSVPATANVTGGLAPFTYSWAVHSGGPFTITSPTNATTTFSGNFETTGTVRVTVTDALGTVATADVEVSLSQRFDSSGS